MCSRNKESCSDSHPNYQTGLFIGAIVVMAAVLVAAGLTHDPDKGYRPETVGWCQEDQYSDVQANLKQARRVWADYQKYLDLGGEPFKDSAASHEDSLRTRNDNLVSGIGEIVCGDPAANMKYLTKTGEEIVIEIYRPKDAKDLLPGVAS